MDWLTWIVLPLVGAVGGFLAGMLGVGGGIIFIPILSYLFTQQGLSNAEVVKYTLANSIFLVFVSGIAGILKQSRSKSLDIQKMMLIGIPGALFSLGVSLIIAHGLPDFSNPGNWLNQQGHWYNKNMFQLVFLGFLLISISNMIFGKPDHKKEGLVENDGNRTGLQIMVAVLAGSVVALSGLGGGVIMVPMFRIILKMPMKNATALSLSIIPFLSLAPLISYIITEPTEPLASMHTGYLAWSYALPIAAAVAIFATLGLKVAKNMPAKVLRSIFATLSSIIFIKTLYEILNP